MASVKAVLSALATCIMTAAPAWAQNGPMPADIAAGLLEIGRVVDPPKTAPLYAPLQEKEPYQGVRVERDVKYGPAERNLLDIFTPEAGSSFRPVLIYVHGGGFVAGNKHPPGSPFYDNVMLWAVRNGFVGINVTYRLAPQATWPAGAEDLAAAVQWVSQNITERGGDPVRVFLMGHSAGAVHVASYVSHPEFYKIRGGGLAGAIMLSGIYDLTATSAGDPEIAYFGADPSRYADRSSLQGLLRSNTPLMIAAAELDPPTFMQQFKLFRDAACKRPSGCITAGLLLQHSHMSEVYSINTDDTELTGEIFTFAEQAGKLSQRRSRRSLAQ
ncbi:alpha/beta hydrolase [uncultured Bradyrhizobium sp.]|uniref:alpha/beta hydrolase n=1 Tax=uncultured Bradyrhizobium sp. TaxID=199684 RepID=UPI0035CA127D